MFDIGEKLADIINLELHDDGVVVARVIGDTHLVCIADSETDAGGRLKVAVVESIFESLDNGESKSFAIPVDGSGKIASGTTNSRGRMFVTDVHLRLLAASHGR